jgi:hypothetical protein
LTVSCRDEPDLPDEYIVIFRSQYFERIVSVELAHTIIKNINAGEEELIGRIARGNYRISVTTQSGLRIEADVNLIGTDPNVRITLTENGRLIFA